MTNIGPSLTITGEITSQEDMLVQGTLKGSITMQQGALVVARTGTAAANVQGSTITVHGQVTGDLSATQQIELTDTANVKGTITTRSLVLREGATVNGKVDVWAKDAGTQAARPKMAVVGGVQKAS